MNKLIISSALAVVITLTACSENISVETRLITAKNYLSENKVNESIIELKNAIRTDGKNGEARFLLGEIYLNQGDGAAAVKELEHAFEFNYEMNKVLPLLARAYILTESDADVIALTETAGSLSPKEYSHYLAYKTLAEIRSEQMARAKDTRALAESVSGKNIYSFLASAYMAFAEQKLDEAESSVLKVLAIDPKQVDALMLQGQLSLISKDYNQAVESFKEYLNYQPKSGIAYIYLSESMLKAKRFDEAEKYADVILAKNSNQPYAHYIKAMVAFHRKDYYKASEHAEFALSSNFNQYTLRLVAGASSFYLKNWESSHRHFSAIVDYLPKEHIGRRMLAVTQLELGLVEDLSDTVASLEGGFGDEELVDALSYQLLALGETNEAKKLIEHNQRATNTAEGNAKQGFLKLMMNDPSGLVDLEEAVELNPDFIQAELALAYGALQNNDIEKAKNIAQKWQQKYPDTAYSYNLLASIALKEQDYEKAESLLKQSLMVEPDNFLALLEQLRSAREQKKTKLSQKRVDYLISLKPHNNAVLKQYLYVYQNEMALSKLQTAHEADKADIDKALLLAEAMISLKQFKQAEDFLNSMVNNPQLPKRYWQLVIFNVKEQDDFSKLQPSLELWIKENPRHIEPVILLADLHVKLGENLLALEVVESGLAHHKESLSLQLIKLDLLLKAKKLAPARTVYGNIVGSNMNEPLKEGFLGRILLLEGNPPEAIPKLHTLYTAYPTAQNILYLASAYLGNNDESKAIELLEEYLSGDDSAVKIRALLAGFYQKTKNAKAKGYYEIVVKQQPRNIFAHNNLAWLYVEQNEMQKALKHAGIAVELAPQNSNVVDTYAQMLSKTGDKPSALNYAKKAAELSQGKNINIQLNYVELLIDNNNTSEVKALLNKITTSTIEQNKKKLMLQSRL